MIIEKEIKEMRICKNRYFDDINDSWKIIYSKNYTIWWLLNKIKKYTFFYKIMLCFKWILEKKSSNVYKKNLNKTRQSVYIHKSSVENNCSNLYCFIFRSIYCEIIYIHTKIFISSFFFIGRAIHLLKIPTKYLFTLVILKIIWNPQSQGPRTCPLSSINEIWCPQNKNDFTVVPDGTIITRAPTWVSSCSFCLRRASLYSLSAAASICLVAIRTASFLTSVSSNTGANLTSTLTCCRW